MIIPELFICLEYTLPESTTLGGEHGIPDSSQPLPPLMHMGYAHAARHSGKNKNTQMFLQTPPPLQTLFDIKGLLELFRVTFVFTSLINKGYHCLSKFVEHFIVFYLKMYNFLLWFLWISSLWI